MIRVILVDDHAAFRQPLRFMLEREEDLTVTGEAGTMAEAAAILDAADVAVVDLGLPDGHGIDLIRTLRTANPRCKVLVLTGSRDRADEAGSVEAGAAGVLHKSAGIDEIIDAVRRVGNGEEIIPVQDLVELLRFASRQREEIREVETAIARLTPRERDVLQALAGGMSDREIAEVLHVSTETVRTHMVNILGKLNLDSRLQALVFAVRHGIASID